MGVNSPRTAPVVLRELANAFESICNLNYLIELERTNPDAVLQYVKMVEVSLKHTTALLIEAQALATEPPARS